MSTPSSAFSIKEVRTARGQRLKTIRKLLHLTLAEFAERLGVSIYSLNNWEINKNNGLPNERINQIVSIINNLNVECSVDWLASGIGLPPKLRVHGDNQTSDSGHDVTNNNSSYDKFIASISKRKRECLELLLAGKSAKETALLLNLSHRTVEAYINMLKVKFECRTKIALISRIHQMKDESGDYYSDVQN